MDDLRTIFQQGSKEVHENLYSGFESKILSSLLLQMVVYFTAIYFPCWFILSIVTFVIKRLESIYQFISAAIYISIPAVEVIRLYFAYEGNIREKIPELGGSWLLTILIQFPLLLFLLFVPGNLQTPLEMIIHPIYFAFLIVHIFACFRIIQKLAWHQTQQYYLASE